MAIMERQMGQEVVQFTQAFDNYQIASTNSTAFHRERRAAAAETPRNCFS